MTDHETLATIIETQKIQNDSIRLQSLTIRWLLVWNLALTVGYIAMAAQL